jgi:hypothetical protein
MRHLQVILALILLKVICFGTEIHRDHTIGIARTYIASEDMVSSVMNWTPGVDEHIFNAIKPSHTFHSCYVSISSHGGTYKDGNPPYSKIPYVYGGFNTPEETKSRIDGNICAGGKDRITGVGTSYWYLRDNPKTKVVEGLGYGNNVPNNLAGIDCSGFISRCWQIPKQNTITLESLTVSISRNNLKQGDILNIAGEHVRLFNMWANTQQTRTDLYEARPPYVIHRTIDFDYNPRSIFPQFSNEAPFAYPEWLGIVDKNPEISLLIRTSRPLTRDNVIFEIDGVVINNYQVDDLGYGPYTWKISYTAATPYLMASMHHVKVTAKNNIYEYNNLYVDTYEWDFRIANEIDIFTDIPVPNKSYLVKVINNVNKFIFTMSQEYYSSTILPEDRRIIFPIQLKDSIPDTLISAYTIGKLKKVNNGEDIQLTLLPDSNHLGQQGYYWLETKRLLAPGEYQFIASANSDFFFPGGDTLNITVTEDLSPSAPRLHAFVRYQDRLGRYRPLPPGTEVLISQTHKYPVYSPDYPHVLIGYKYIEEWVGTGYTAGCDGYVNAPLTSLWSGGIGPKQFRVVANCLSWDRESGGIKAFGKYGDQTHQYFKSASWVFYAAADSASPNVYRPTATSVVTIYDYGCDQMQGNVKFPYETCIPGIACDMYDDYGWPTIQPRFIQNYNSALGQMDAVVESYDFAKSLVVTAGLGSSTGLNVPGIKFKWSPTRVDMSGGWTRYDEAAGLLKIMGEVGDPSTPLGVNSDEWDSDLIARAYGQHFYKRIASRGNYVGVTDNYRWGTRTPPPPTPAGGGCIQQAFEKGFAWWFAGARKQSPIVTDYDANGNPIAQINLADGSCTVKRAKLAARAGYTYIGPCPDGGTRTELKGLDNPSNSQAGLPGSGQAINGGIKAELKGLDNESAAAMQVIEQSS